MNEYITVNCIESCPTCINLLNMTVYDKHRYTLDCKHIKDIIINPSTTCNGMYEPIEVRK